MFDLGQYGSNNDSGVLLNSKMGQMFQENQLEVPKSRTRDGIDGSLPFYLLGDEIINVVVRFYRLISPHFHILVKLFH